MLDPFLGLWELIEGLNWLGKGNVALLTLLLLVALVITLHGFHRYSIARRQTRAFVNDIGAMLPDGKFDEVNAIAAQYDRSHVASIVTAGPTAFASVRSRFSQEKSIGAAVRAIHRSHKVQAAELKLGFDQGYRLNKIPVPLRVVC
jgi:hypothetical protein